jgi:hypothetical protein
VTEPWADCRRLSQVDGLVAGLSALCGMLGPKVLPFGPGGHAVVPRSVAETATSAWFGGVLSERAAEPEQPLTDELLSAAGLVALRRAVAPTPRLAEADRWWATGIAWVRIGVSATLAEGCLAHLETRSLLGNQLVAGQLADALIGQLTTDALLLGGSRPTPVLLREAHRQITETDRALSRLCGAGGFLADGPGAAVHLSELLADVYLGGTP